MRRMSFAEWLMIIGCALVLLGYLGDIAHADVWEDTQQVVVGFTLTFQPEDLWR
jgi:hypothetical protein